MQKNVKLYTVSLLITFWIHCRCCREFLAGTDELLISEASMFLFTLSVSIQHLCLVRSHPVYLFISYYKTW